MLLHKSTMLLQIRFIKMKGFQTILQLSYSLLVFSLLMEGCQSKKEAEKQEKFSMNDIMMNRCEFTDVVETDVENELNLFGKIAAENSKTAQVYPIVGGNVVSINVEIGDFVKQGEILAVVRSSEVADFQRQRLDAQADLALAEKISR